MTLRSDGRRVISATMQPELYDRLYAHCKKHDIPITVFVRDAISKALPSERIHLIAYARAATNVRQQPATASHSWAAFAGPDAVSGELDP